MYYLKSEAAFDSAHFLSGYDGKCKNLHGHRWRVVAEIKSETLSEEKQTRGMVIDFGDLKSALKGLCDNLDHSLIYEDGCLKAKTIEALYDEGFRLIPVSFRPTAENFAKYFYDLLAKQGFEVNRVEVFETPNNSATYQV